MVILLPPDIFLYWGLKMLGRQRPIGQASFVDQERFAKVFGVSHMVCAIIWRLLVDKTDYITHKVLPQFLLWALHEMHEYTIETNACGFVALPKAPDEKTFRKWTWYLIEAINMLEGYVVSML